MATPPSGRADDAFPRERFIALAAPPCLRAPGVAPSRDTPEPRAPHRGRGAAATSLPIDLVPGIIPVAGQLDDARCLRLRFAAARRGSQRTSMPPA